MQPAENVAVSVGVRFRPLNEREERTAAAAASRATNDGLKVSPAVAFVHDAAAGYVKSVQGTRRYEADFVFGPTASNADVSDEMALPVVDAALDGYNGCVMMYGTSGSGKTHSMTGGGGEKGVVALMLERVFEAREEGAGGRRFRFFVQYTEIYNEKVRDLLGGEENMEREVRILESTKSGTSLDATKVEVGGLEEAQALFETGNAARSVGGTKVNATSSRSHAVFTLLLESQGVSVVSDLMMRRSKLQLVDLAGSERSEKAGTTGAALREGNSINKSLLTLGKIVNILGSVGEKKVPDYLPYRDSKLTRVLRDALGGNSRTAIVCTCTPSVHLFQETTSTLLFAERARSVTNEAKKNEVVDFEARALKAELQVRELRLEMEGMRKVDGADVVDIVHCIGDGKGADMAKLDEEFALQMASKEIALLRERVAVAEASAQHAKNAAREKSVLLRDRDETVATFEARWEELRTESNDQKRDFSVLKTELLSSQRRSPIYMKQKQRKPLACLGEKITSALMSWNEYAAEKAAEYDGTAPRLPNQRTGKSLFPINLEGFLERLQNASFYLILVEEWKDTIGFDVRDSSCTPRPRIAKAANKLAKGRALVGASIASELFSGSLLPACGTIVKVESYSSALANVLATIAVANEADGVKLLQEIIMEGKCACADSELSAFRLLSDLAKEFLPLTLEFRSQSVEVLYLSLEDAFILVISLGKVNTLLNPKKEAKVRAKPVEWNYFRNACVQANTAIKEFNSHSNPDPSLWNSLTKLIQVSQEVAELVSGLAIYV